MRNTVHLVSARDCLQLRPLVQPVIDRGFYTNRAHREGLEGVDIEALSAAGRALLEERPRTAKELGELLRERWPERDPASLARAIRHLVPLVQVPPRGVWGKSGPAAHTTAEAWLSHPLDPGLSLEELVIRYLGTFGPASVKDVQAWSGLTRLGEVVDRLRPRLLSFRDERGRELFDLPDAPRPDPDTPAPPRFLPNFDNLILSHADRTRVVAVREPRTQAPDIRPHGGGSEPPGAYRIGFFASRRWRKRHGNLFAFLRKLVLALPVKSAPDTPEVWNMDHAGARMGMLNEGFVRANCEALEETMADCGADVVVDFWNPFAVIAARVLQKPLITVIQADAHPLSQGFIWWKTPPKNIPTPVPVVNKVLADYNLQPVEKLGELCVGDLTLVVGMPETDPIPENADVIYIGPILWQKQEAKLPDWIGHLSREKPLIWVYSGNPRYSSGGDSLDSIVVLHACIAALADEDVQVVLTTGHHPLPREMLPLPANFRHEPYVPGLAMAERSDLLIHHGGYGSCQTGLYAGKPAVIIPTYSERESNARRIAALGAGTFVAVENVSGEKRVRTEELRATIRRVLADPSFADNARRTGERMRAYGGASRAAHLIERFGQRAGTGEFRSPVDPNDSNSVTRPHT